MIDATMTSLRRRDVWLLAAITLVGLLLRLWGLGDKGLAYDEAATALMARAAPAEIIAFPLARRVRASAPLAVDDGGLVGDLRPKRGDAASAPPRWPARPQSR
jgi:hypothetical protein